MGSGERPARFLAPGSSQSRHLRQKPAPETPLPQEVRTRSLPSAHRCTEVCDGPKKVSKLGISVCLFLGWGQGFVVSLVLFLKSRRHPGTEGGGGGWNPPGARTQGVCALQPVGAPLSTHPAQHTDPGPASEEPGTDRGGSGSAGRGPAKRRGSSCGAQDAHRPRGTLHLAPASARTPPPISSCATGYGKSACKSHADRTYRALLFQSSRNVSEQRTKAVVLS